jgi:tyrosyl-tRNA synthetase
VLLAQEIVARFHSRDAASKALTTFNARFRDGALPDEMPELRIGKAPMGKIKVLREAGLVASGSEAQRNIEQGGVRIDGQRIEDKSLQLGVGTYVLQIGKRKFARVTLSVSSSLN